MRLILIGFMGSGKSCLAGELATRYRLPCYDIDSLIEEETGSSIEEIFMNRGEEWFRMRERKVLCQLPDETVIATGGGVIEISENRQFLKQQENFTIWLHPPFSLIYERIDGSRRPKIRGLNREGIYSLWKERLPLYRECSNLSFNSSSSDFKELFREIDWLFRAVD